MSARLHVSGRWLTHNPQMVSATLREPGSSLLLKTAQFATFRDHRFVGKVIRASNAILHLREAQPPI